MEKTVGFFSIFEKAPWYPPFMIRRLLQRPTQAKKSFFLFGPRGTGKTWWVREQFPSAIYIDLLDTRTLIELLARPQLLEERIPPGFDDWIVIDEVQKAPALLNEVHRLIESRKLAFVLTGSSGRALRRQGVNLLAGRALTVHMHPLTWSEMGGEASLARAIHWGCLPSLLTEEEPLLYLTSYVQTYLREEVLEEGLMRSLGEFHRFLEAASFSQAQLLNLSQVAREAAIPRRQVESFFTILEDLLIAVQLPIFQRRAKRRLTAHPKFFFFDAGVFRAIRPKGPLDTEADIDGPALETLLLQQIRAINDYGHLGYNVYYWRTDSGLEVDFVLYGERGLLAWEIKRSATFNDKDLRGLLAFGSDYPEAELFLLYNGRERRYRDKIQIIPFEEAIRELPLLLERPG